MNIIIEKRNASIGYDFLVFSNGVNIISAVSEKLLGFFKISIWNNSNNEKVIRVKNKKFDFFWRPGYWIYNQGKRNEFKTKSFHKRHFQFDFNGSLYEIYGHHKSWKYSVYMNNIQIAWWDKKTQKHQGPDLFKIEMNDDCNVELITSFCLILDDFIDIGVEDRGKMIDMEGRINIDYKMYGEIKSFNNDWTPNSSITACNKS